MKFQMISLIALSMLLGSCGGKKSSKAPQAKRNPVVNENNNKLDFSRITVSNAQIVEKNSNLTRVRGAISGDIDSVIPCSLKNPIALNKKNSANLNRLSLREVVVADRGITKGSMQSFDISVNGKNKRVVGMDLKNNEGVFVAGQASNYNDAQGQECTQLMTESYEALDSKGAITKKSLKRVSVFAGSDIYKTTILMNDDKIIKIQMEKKDKEGKKIEQYCIQDAKLAAK